MSRRSVAGADLMWRDETVVIAVGPIAPPSGPAIERALVQLAEYPDASRIGWQPSASGRRWVTTEDLAGFVHGCVHEWPDASGSDPSPVLERALHLDRGSRPVAVIVAADMVLLVIDHLLADGYSMTRLLGAVIETATTGAVPEALRRSPARRALLRATWDHFGRHPGRVPALVRHARTHRATTITAHERSLPVRGRWRPSPASRIGRSGPQALKELKEWRREHASGVSTVPLTIAAAEAARQRLEIPLVAPPLILFDARRYVRPGGIDVAGNFCAGLRINAADGADPVILDAAIKRAVDLGRPLAVVAAAATALRVRRPEAAPAHNSPASEAWDVAYTHMGRPPELSRLRWQEHGERPYYIGLLPPNGPAGVTLGISETGHRINISVSFHDNVVRGELVGALLELLMADPAGLLEAHRTSGRQPAGA